MEYRNLVTFLRVAELQNFTQAANALGYAQSTVTFHIQSLEEELGVVLFDRIGKRVSLTMAGEYLISYANDIMHLESAIRDLNKNLETLPGTLRIGVVESLLSVYAGRIVEGYRELHPQIALEIQSGSSPELMELLRENNVDLILFMGRRIVEPHFVRDLIRPADVSFVTAASSPLAKKKTVKFSDLIREPLILPEKSSLYRKMAEEVAAHFDCMLEPAVQINSTAVILRLLKRGLGVSFLPDYLTRPGVQAGELALLPVESWAPQEYFIQLLHHKNKRVTPQMRWFVSLMEETLGTSAG